ncbi:MAG: single-stranded DNA-binding protein, partial [Coriobacteriia bacterium]|nr:single-stranded DNA-binding protein [Coriobacteriia bacterium]
SKILTKGMKVAIEGKLRYSSWEKDGQRRSKIDINVDEIEFLTPRNNTEASTPPPVQREVEIPPAPEITIYDEDIPF